MNLELFVEELLDIAREQSHGGAKMIIVDRIEKDILRPMRSLISTVEPQDGNPRPITDADLIESANRNYDLGRKHGKEEIAEELNAPKCSVCLKPTKSYCVSCGAVVCFRCNCPNWPMGVKTHPITQPEDDRQTTTVESHGAFSALT